MAKFFGKVGYVEWQTTSPGVSKEVIVEHDHQGDVLQNTNRFEKGDSVNDDLNVDNTISILSNAYSDRNFSAIRYVVWMGTAWKVTKVAVKRPRLILSIGGVYNGPKT